MDLEGIQGEIVEMSEIAEGQPISKCEGVFVIESIDSIGTLLESEIKLPFLERNYCYKKLYFQNKVEDYLSPLKIPREVQL